MRATKGVVIHMTQKQKTWHKIGIVFLALSLVCAVLYIWFSTQDAWAWLIGTIAGPDTEDSNPLIGFAATLAIGFTEWMGAMGGLLLSLLGAILSLGTVLWCMGKPFKIAGGVGIALHIGLLIAFFVRYHAFLGELFSF